MPTFVELIRKFNPYHDGRGRFSSFNGAVSMTQSTNYGPGQKAIQNLGSAKFLEKSKMVADAYAQNSKTSGAKSAVGYQAVKFAKWRDDITPEEKEAITNYTDSGFRVYNRLLREGPLTPSKDYFTNEAHKNIGRIASGLDKASMPEDTMVYRGASYKMFAELGITEKTTQSELNNFVGKKFTEKSFVSTTQAKEKAFDQPVSLKYCLPKGAKAAGVSQISIFKWEAEVLIQRGSNFRILSAERGKGAALNVTLEYLP